MRVPFKNLDHMLKRLLPKVPKAEQLLRSEQAKILYCIYASVLQDVICSGPSSNASISIPALVPFCPE